MCSKCAFCYRQNKDIIPSPIGWRECPAMRDAALRLSLGTISLHAMAHSVQHTPLPAPYIKLQSRNWSHYQSLIRLLALVMCRRRRVTAASLLSISLWSNSSCQEHKQRTSCIPAVGDSWPEGCIWSSCEMWFLPGDGVGSMALWPHHFGKGSHKLRGASICFSALLQGLAVVGQQMLAPLTFLLYSSWFPCCFHLLRSLFRIVFLLCFCLLGQPSDL